MIAPIASLACVLMFGGVTPAAFTAQMHCVAAAQKIDTEVVVGVIAQIDLEERFFILNKVEDDHRIRISVNDRTIFFLDGERSTMSEALRAGREASVTHIDRTATRVEVKSTN